jgi:hypothetical protein
MTKSTVTQPLAAQSDNHSGDVLVRIEKAASAAVRQAKRIRAAVDQEGDAVTAHMAMKQLREHLTTLEKLSLSIADREAAYSDRADRQFLELESAIREACARRGWRVDGQWPTLYVERAITIELSEEKRTVALAGERPCAPTAEAVVAALEPVMRDLLPRDFSTKGFIQELATAYDTARADSTLVPIFDLYRSLVVRAQSTKFWRDARPDAFVGISAAQFRARLAAALEAGVTSTPDGRAIRLLPPLNPRDGLFMYLPAESRYGFVGRVEFVPEMRTEAQ